MQRILKYSRLLHASHNSSQTRSFTKKIDPVPNKDVPEDWTALKEFVRNLAIQSSANSKDISKISSNLDKLEASTTKLQVSTTKLEASTTKLEATSLNLVENRQNRANQLEQIFGIAFEKWLVNELYTDQENFNSQEGIFIDRNKKDLVQWDYILNASRNGVKFLFLMEVKEYAHLNDILPQDGIPEHAKRKTLLFRVLRTIELNDSLKTNLKGTSVRFQNQANLFHGVKIIIVFASSNLRDDLKKAVSSLKDYVELKNAASRGVELEFWCAEFDQKLEIIKSTEVV